MRALSSGHARASGVRHCMPRPGVPDGDTTHSTFPVPRTSCCRLALGRPGWLL